jgi:hypothetical protein
MKFWEIGDMWLIGGKFLVFQKWILKGRQRKAVDMMFEQNWCLLD